MKPRNSPVVPASRVADGSTVKRRPHRPVVWALLALLVLSAVGVALFGDFVEGFERPAPPLPARVDVIVVLSGGSGRFDEGLRLLREGRAPMLYLVGFKRRAVAARLEQDTTAAALARDGRIVVEPTSSSTLDDARHARALVERQGARSMLLITSVYHLRRADLTFRSVLPASVELHVHPVRSSTFQTDGWFEDESSRRIVFSEFFKYLLYRARLAVAS